MKTTATSIGPSALQKERLRRDWNHSRRVCLKAWIETSQSRRRRQTRHMQLRKKPMRHTSRQARKKLLRFTNKLKRSETRFIKRLARRRPRLLPLLIMKLYRMISGNSAPIMMPQSGSSSASFPFSSCKNSSG